MDLINSWLDDRQRTYAGGLCLFKQAAPECVKKNLLPFLEEVKDVPEFDTHYGVLYNAMFRLRGVVIESLQNNDMKPVLSKSDNAVIIPDVMMKQLDLEDALEELRNDKERSDEDVSDQIRSLENKIDELKMNNSVKGARIMDLSELPESMQKKFRRIKEITPEYAATFTEMQNISLSNEERLGIATKCRDLFQERAKLWNEIDKEDEVKSEEKEERNDMQFGVEIQRRIERLKENIRRTAVAAEQHEKSGKLNLKASAEMRLKRYNIELEELKKKVDAN